MSFDFNKEPLRLYGIFPQTPFPLEVSIYGYCRMSCSYCFANRNRDAFGRELNLTNSTPALFRKIARAMADDTDPIGFFLREKYPICFSNTTDPFQRDEKNYRATEAFLGWARAEGTPLYIQTRGNVLFEEFERYAPLIEPGRCVVYISICQLDERDRKRHEPGAMSLDKRWELARMLSDRGVPVVAACNPYLKEWVPDPDRYCELAKESGVRGIWLEHLHFTAAQSETLAAPYADLIPKANLAPMYMIGILKRWYEATGSRGLDFFPTPKWDAYFGHRARFPECADPKWLGGKTFGINFDFLSFVAGISEEEGGKRVIVTWDDFAAYAEHRGVPNPTLDTAPFWYPYNASVKADYRAFRAALGSTAPLHEILRYFWNHPYENQHLMWYHPLIQALWHSGAGEYSTDHDDNLMAVYNPSIKHHGAFEHPEEDVDWNLTVMLQLREALRDIKTSEV